MQLKTVVLSPGKADAMRITVSITSPTVRPIRTARYSEDILFLSRYGIFMIRNHLLFIFLFQEFRNSSMSYPNYYVFSSALRTVPAQTFRHCQASFVRLSRMPIYGVPGSGSSKRPLWRPIGVTVMFQVSITSTSNQVLSSIHICLNDGRQIL